MIKLSMKLKETEQSGVVAVEVSVDTEPAEATPAERVTLGAIRHMLSNDPSTLGHGRGQSREEAYNNALEKSEIARDILKAGMPIPKGADKPQ